MASEFYRKLEDLEDLIEDSWTMPIAKNKYIVDGEKFRAIVDALRDSLPAELEKSKEIVANRDNITAKAKEEYETAIERAKKNAEIILTKAKSNAENIIAEAQEEAERLVSEQEITQIANQRAADVVEKARQDAIKMKDVTFSYIDKVISESENSLEGAMNALCRVKQSFSASNEQQDN